MDDGTTADLAVLLRDIRTLLRIGLTPALEELWRDAFEDDSTQTQAFRLLAAGRSYREIGDEIGASHTTVGRWVNRWKGLGLIDPATNACLLSPSILGL